VIWETEHTKKCCFIFGNTYMYIYNLSVVQLYEVSVLFYHSEIHESNLLQIVCFTHFKFFTSVLICTCKCVDLQAYLNFIVKG